MPKLQAFFKEPPLLKPWSSDRPMPSKLLRLNARPATDDGGEQVQDDSEEQNAIKKCKVGSFNYEAAFGLPWDEQSFIARACEVGHPSLHDAGVPEELVEVVNKHVEWGHEALSAYRRDWCKKWLCRAKELDVEERRLRATRPDHVQRSTAERDCLSLLKS